MSALILDIAALIQATRYLLLRRLAVIAALPTEVALYGARAAAAFAMSEVGIDIRHSKARLFADAEPSRIVACWCRT